MNALTWAVAAVVTDDAGRVLLCRQGPVGRWALPGGRMHRAECPQAAVVRDIRAETGWDVDLVDLLGLYQLTARDAGTAGRPGPLPDVLVHVFRARARGEGPTTAPLGGCRLTWHPPADLPVAVTPITGAALADALAGRSGVLRDATPETWRAPDPVQAGPAQAAAIRTDAVSPAGGAVPPGQRADPDGARTNGP
ncbi:NUDIX hydrolase [Micromonospora coerulea]|uniref:NUDIX hydrolase n=1 Tax=Micromonospora coerulea TaxID=47856 RepID=UPI00190502FE|nr:NUDIX hydrolase [Micromonospora veneta]